MQTPDASVPRFKVVVVGPGGAGKTSLIRRHLSGDFKTKYEPTVGMQANELKFETTKGPVILDIWDCGGQKQNQLLGDGYYICARGAILVFDVTSNASYKGIEPFFKDLRRVTWDAPIVLVGNKAESTSRNRVVKPKDVTFHRRHQLVYHETSAKSNYNFNKPFLSLLRSLLNDPGLEIISDNPNASTDDQALPETVADTQAGKTTSDSDPVSSIQSVWNVPISLQFNFSFDQKDNSLSSSSSRAPPANEFDYGSANNFFTQNRTSGVDQPNSAASTLSAVQTNVSNLPADKSLAETPSTDASENQSDASIFYRFCQTMKDQFSTPST